MNTSLREVYIALAATLLTLAFAVGLYTILPRQGVKSLLEHTYTHTRDFRVTPAGGEIVYSGTDSLERLTLDVQVLSRRFERGHFEIITLPGSKFSPEVAAMRPLAKSYRYSVTQDGKNAILKIEGGPQAPLAAYLNYLKTNWSQ